MTYRYPSSHVFHRPLGREMRAIDRGSGALLWDRDGRRYIDGSGGRRGREHRPRPRRGGRPRWRSRRDGRPTSTAPTSPATSIEEYAGRLAKHAPGRLQSPVPRVRRLGGQRDGREAGARLPPGERPGHPLQGDPPLDLLPRQHDRDALALGPAQPAGALQADAPGSCRRLRRRSAITARSTRRIPTATSPASTSWRP